MIRAKVPVVSGPRPFPAPGGARYVPSFKETLLMFLMAAAATVVVFLTVHPCR
jgi:hypothetical protein